MDIDKYHAAVEVYYDQDAGDFEERYWSNPVLQRIRQSFREILKSLPFERALEIGCGPGIDLAHLATIFPEKQLHGIDISGAMVSHAQAKLKAKSLENARVLIATTDDLPALFSEEQFDLIFVFFGALNTVPDLEEATEKIFSRLSRDGHLFVSFVNKFYLAEIFIHLLKGRPRSAFRRFRSSWGGYSESKYLHSKCYSPRQVRRICARYAFEIQRTGFSILYPAWYRAQWVENFSRLTKFLWKIDQILNKTWLWGTGEYISFVYRKY